jgi:hypothetical protein
MYIFSVLLLHKLIIFVVLWCCLPYCKLLFHSILINVIFRLPLWSSGQSSWLQIQRSGFNSWRYQIFREIVGLERGPLRLVSTIEELLGRKSSGSYLENREYGHRDPSHWPHGTLHLQKLALTSLTSGGCSVGMVRLWTQVTEFSLLVKCYIYI